MIIVEIAKSRSETVERGSERSTRTRSSEIIIFTWLNCSEGSVLLLI